MKLDPTYKLTYSYVVIPTTYYYYYYSIISCQIIWVTPKTLVTPLSNCELH